MDRLKGVTSAYIESCVAVGFTIPNEVWPALFNVHTAAYLGRDEIGLPMSNHEAAKVGVIYERLSRTMRHMAPIPCYGRRAAQVATPNEGDPVAATPLLNAMLDVMDDDGHDTNLVRTEIDALKARIAYLTTHLRAAKYQTDAAIAGIIATMPAMNDAISSLPQIF